MDGLYATNFFLFAAMGINSSSRKEVVISAAIDRAFRDASSAMFYPSTAVMSRGGKSGRPPYSKPLKS